MGDTELIDLAAVTLTSAAADGRTIQSPTSAAMALLAAGMLKPPGRVGVDAIREALEAAAPRPSRLDEHRAMDLLETAWGIIANAGGGDWQTQDPAWQAAAKDWREGYHDVLDGWVGQRPQTFRKMPIEVEAMNWDGTPSGATPIINWILDGDGTATFVDHPPRMHSEFCRCDGRGVVPGPAGTAAVVKCPETEPTGGRPSTINIHTLEGVMSATAGDWIIRGIEGEFYPCKPSVFSTTYERAPADAIPTTVPMWEHRFVEPHPGIEVRDREALCVQCGRTWKAGSHIGNETSR